MPILAVDRLTFGHGAEPLLRGLSFGIEEGERVALVGNNGSGKSTLLALLLGRLEADRGRVQTRRGLSIGHAEQILPPALEGVTARDAVTAALPAESRADFAWRVEMALDAFGFTARRKDLRLAELSGGWRRLVLLARAAVADPDLLLLDEPTNHLDLAKILRVERWLAEEVTVPVVLISHDRALLDAVTTRTLILRDGRVVDYAYPFGRARQLLAEQDVIDARARAVEEAEIKRLQRSAKRLAEWGRVFDNEKFSRRAKSMEKRIEVLKEERTAVAAPDRRDLSLDAAAARPPVLLRCTGLAVAAPDGRPLLRVETLALRRGDRLAVLGANGSGKTTLLRRLLAAAEEPPAGPAATAPAAFNPQVRVGWFDQEMTRLAADQPLHGFFVSRFPIGDREARQALIRAGFPVTEQQRPIGQLSGGERARLMFLLLRLERPNVLILDEPTNHLDIAGRERLEEEIVEQGLTAILVSHDRRFVEAVATRWAMIDRGRLIEIDGPEAFHDRLMARPEAAPRTPAADELLARILAVEDELRTAPPALAEGLRARLDRLYAAAARAET